jgi:hypothetical protein
MIILPGVKGIIRRVSPAPLPELTYTGPYTVSYRPEYIYDGLGNKITTNNTPVEYWQPYNNLGTNVFNIFVDGGGGGGGTTSFIQQNPSTTYGGLYTGGGSLSDGIQPLINKVDGNPIEYIGGVGSVGPVYRSRTACMGDRPSVYFDGSGGYLKVDSTIPANRSSNMWAWMFSNVFCFSSAPSTETTIATLGNAANNNVYYTYSLDATNFYIKTNTGSFTAISNYTLDTPYFISMWKYVTFPVTTSASASRVFFNIYNNSIATLAATPTNFPDGSVFNWQFKLLNTTQYHFGDFIILNLISSSAGTWNTIRSYYATKYGSAY